MAVTGAARKQAGIYYDKGGAVLNVQHPDFGAKGDGIADDTSAIQAAMDAAGYITGLTVFFPQGIYRITNRILNQTSAGRVVLRGEGHRRTIIKADPGLINTQMIRFGNNTGHGVYQAFVIGLGFDGGDKAQGNTALMLHEAGLSLVRDFAAERCGAAIEAPGAIFASIEGKNFVSDCSRGIIFTRPTTGVPADQWDTTKTSSPLSLSTNVSRVQGVWFNGVVGEVIRGEGGLFQIRDVVLQSCGADLTKDLITLSKANESFDYGAGPGLDGVWIEGGSYRYAIASRDTRAGNMKNVFISGSSTNDPANFPKEGGILLGGTVNGSSNWNIDESVSVRGFFVAPVTEGRLANAAMYVNNLSKSYKSNLRPYTVKTQCQVYHEGVASPLQTKARMPHWACVKFIAGVPTITAASSDFINSIAHGTVGEVTITYKFNRDAVAAGFYPINVYCHTTSATKTWRASTFGDNGQVNDRIIFTDELGVKSDPWGFTIFMYGEINTV